jgi:cytochrome P450
MARMALEDIEIAGATIRRGGPILLMLCAAHRDPEAFGDPDRLDITRRRNRHLAFEHDAHYCVGAALARLEAQVAIGTLARRVPRLRLETDELDWEDTLMIRGLRSLPVLLS